MVITGLAPALLLGCAEPQRQEQPGATRAPEAVGTRPEETLRVGIGVRPDTLEIARVTNSATANLLENVVETLTTIDENGKVVPNLARRWEASPDSRTFTFDLPRGATFQDGAPLNADAVTWNVNRLVQVNAVAACPTVALELAALRSVQPVDADTVRFNFSRPVPNFPATLSWIAWGILSPRSAELPGNKLTDIQRPVGTGPFAFEALSADQLQLRRFDRFRGERPFFGRLAFNFISSPQERQERLTSNRLDVVLAPSVGQTASLARNARFAVRTKPGTRSIFVPLNNQRPPFNDVRVRRAVNLAIDKQAIINQLLRGAATVSDAPVAPGVLGYCRIGPYRYDPAAAKALLAEAKVAQGTRLTLLTTRGRYLEDEAASQSIARYLRAVGFQVTVQPVEFPALIRMFNAPPQQVKADMHLFGWAPTFADAGYQLPELFDSRRWPPLGPASSFYKNPEVDKMLEAANRELDRRTRADLFCKASRQIWDDAPVIFLWVQSFPVAHRAGLTNIVTLPNEKVSLAFARPTPAPTEPGTPGGSR